MDLLDSIPYQISGAQISSPVRPDFFFVMFGTTDYRSGGGDFRLGRAAGAAGADASGGSQSAAVTAAVDATDSTGRIAPASASAIPEGGGTVAVGSLADHRPPLPPSGPSHPSTPLLPPPPSTEAPSSPDLMSDTASSYFTNPRHGGGLGASSSSVSSYTASTAARSLLGREHAAAAAAATAKVAAAAEQRPRRSLAVEAVACAPAAADEIELDGRRSAGGMRRSKSADPGESLSPARPQNSGGGGSRSAGVGLGAARRQRNEQARAMSIPLCIWSHDRFFSSAFFEPRQFNAWYRRDGFQRPVH
ncbi:hypothetical protein HK405_014469, partial [Cladochytrium tenue]